MKVLTVFAHNDRRSFCGGVLDRFSSGLADAGHTNEVLDLYAIKFDPVFRDRDVASYTSGDTPADILELMNLEERAAAVVPGAAAAVPGITGDARQVTLGDRGDDPQSHAQGRARPAGEGRRRGRVRVDRTRALLQLPVDPQGLDRPCLHPRLRVRPHLGRVARRHQREDPASPPSARPAHVVHHLRQGRLRRRHPRRDRQGHRRLGFPLPRHPGRRTRLLLRGHRGPTRDDQDLPRPGLRSRQDLRRTPSGARRRWQSTESIKRSGSACRSR